MVVDLALSTRLRVSEMAALTIGEADFKRGTPKVTRLRRKKQSTEMLAIGRDLLQHLKEYLEWTGRKKGPLLVGQRRPIACQGLQQTWKAAIKRVGLSGEMSIHAARHSIAVHLLKKAGNLRQVRKQLGYASSATTANMYADIAASRTCRQG